jgi:hypothetical protein
MVAHRTTRAWPLLAATLLSLLASLLTAPPAHAAPAWQLPVPAGATVDAGGPHAWGLGSDRSAVDLGGDFDVSAAAGGTAFVIARDGAKQACQIKVVHADGWETRYAHITSVPAPIASADPKKGYPVSAGTVLGHTKAPMPDPTCNGDKGNFQHLHFGLFKSGQPVAIDGISIGGYTVRAVPNQNYCGYWVRNSDQTIVADARQGSRYGCVASPSVTNNQAVAPTTPAPAPDADADGTPDSSDWCPTVPGPATNHGCPTDVIQVSGDVDGDGKSDVVAISRNGDNSPNIHWFRSTSGSTPSLAEPQQLKSLPAPAWNMNNLKWSVGDFNGDKKTDLFVASGSATDPPNLYVLLSDGTSLANPVLVKQPNPTAWKWDRLTF